MKGGTEYDFIEIESAWRETFILCEKCGGMTYSDGKSRPQCGDDGCLELVSDERIWEWLITRPSEQDEGAYFIRWQLSAPAMHWANGRGKQAFPRSEAQTIADRLNSEHPTIRHWIEPAERIERAEREAGLDNGTSSKGA